MVAAPQDYRVKKRISKTVWKWLLAGNGAFILAYWWQGSGALFSQGAAGSAVALGRLSGLLAAGFVLLQFIFMSRTPLLERSFGLDKIARIHRRHGKLSLIFLALHPLLLTVGYSWRSGLGLIPQFFSFLLNYQHVWLAAIGWVLFILVITTSLVIVRGKLRYESWYFVHLLVYLAVFLAFWHQIRIGSDLLSSRVFYTYWIVLYAVVLTNHLLFRFLRPLYLFDRHQFTISRLVNETHNTVSIYIRGRNLHKFAIEPGQFMILRFLTKGMWWQAHPFSLSLVPTSDELRVTIKAVGNFTATVRNVPVGTKVLIDGPYGIFTEAVSVSPKVLFIAGGIGITPIRSLMEQVLKKKKDAVLLYANKTARDIVFKTELEELSSRYGAPIVNILSNEPNYTGEKGLLDAQSIKRLVPDLPSREVYLCGPVPMMDRLRAALVSLGVPLAKIHYEKFAL